VNPFGPAQSLGESHLLYLPDGGSLGVRATEFDWHAVYGVDPRDARFIIAPDIRNGVVKVTRDGGAIWTTDAELTDLVTGGGSLLMYDGQYHMQVTDIAFDPFHPQRVFVATRDAGIIVSNDGGANWSRIPASESILYATGFGFQQDRTVYVSSYGRGLWKIEFPDERASVGRIRDLVLCAIFDCRLRPFPDPRVRKISWTDDPVILAHSGRITDADIDEKGRLRKLTVTPGTRVLRYAPDGEMPEFEVVELKGRAKAQKLASAESVMAGYILQDGLVAYALELPRELTADDIAKGVVEEKQQQEPDRKPARPRRQPYVIVTTSVSIPGQPILGADRLLYIKGYDFPPEAKLVARIDGVEVDAHLTVDAKGNVSGKVHVPEEHVDGLHTIEIVDRTSQREVILAKSTFLIAATDDVRKE
jgi:hypothetical protein